MEATSLHGPILLWHKMLDTATIRRVRYLDRIDSSCILLKSEGSSMAGSGEDDLNFGPLIIFVSILLSFLEIVTKDKNREGVVTGSSVLGRWNI